MQVSDLAAVDLSERGSLLASVVEEAPGKPEDYGAALECGSRGNLELLPRPPKVEAIGQQKAKDSQSI